jgi:hypothetical protein
MLARTEVQMMPLIGRRYRLPARRENSRELTCFLSNNLFTGLPHRPPSSDGHLPVFSSFLTSFLKNPIGLAAGRCPSLSLALAGR